MNNIFVRKIEKKSEFIPKMIEKKRLNVLVVGIGGLFAEVKQIDGRAQRPTRFDAINLLNELWIKININIKNKN